jgi:hypothetical protein
MSPPVANGHASVGRSIISVRRLLGAACLVVLLGVFAWKPLQRVGASAIVNAPNRGLPSPPTRARELRVAVGPPSATLSLEIMDAATPSATVFVLHGIRDEKESMRGWGRMLADAGFRAVLLDLRGHGRSTGDWLSYGVVESRDLARALDSMEAQGLASSREQRHRHRVSRSSGGRREPKDPPDRLNADAVTAALPK